MAIIHKKKKKENKRVNFGGMTILYDPWEQVVKLTTSQSINLAIIYTVAHSLGDMYTNACHSIIKPKQIN